MKFLVDAHLPTSVCSLLEARGCDALHTRNLPAQNATTDSVIKEISACEQRVVISKDSDFYYSHLLQGRPQKLVIVTTGNMRLRDFTALFDRQADALIAALSHHSLVELDRTSVKPII